MDKNTPIGVFDSGVGELTVAGEIMRQTPEERLAYFGDAARLSYGSKSREAVIHFPRQILRFLEFRGMEAVAIACSTTSVYALEIVEKEVGTPVIEAVNAGARTAVNTTRNSKTDVMGTEGTISSSICTKVIWKMKPDIEVTGKSYPLLVPLVEEGPLHDSVTDEIIPRYLSVLKGRYINTLVSGYIHYLLLRSTLERPMGSEITLANPAYETTIGLKQLLKERQMDCIPQDAAGEKYQFYVSDLAEKFTAFATSILSNETKETKKIDIEEC